MKKIILLLLFIPAFAIAQEPEARGLNSDVAGSGFHLYFNKGDVAMNQIKRFTKEGLSQISNFFDKQFKKEVGVYLFPSRASLDAQWQKDWGMPEFKSKCWMVGSGIQSKLDLLSPSAWEKEACEHDPEDSTEIMRLVVHELTHVLHSDYNRSPAFDNINNIDWFVEGLATYASGQLDKERYDRMAAYVRESGGPKLLENFWKGEHRYGLSGSIVQYIDQSYGRRLLSELMEYNDLKDILGKLNLSENELIEAWKKSVVNSGKQK